MLRVHFAAEDLSKTRIGASYGPLAETVFSLDALQRRPSPVLFGDWRRSLSGQLDDTVKLLADLIPRAWIFDLISIVGPSSRLDEGIEAFCRAPRSLVRGELTFTASTYRRPPTWAGGLVERDSRTRRQLVAALQDLHHVAVEPHWHRTSALLQAEQARLMRVMTEHGVGVLLASLHPAIRWQPPVLHIRSPAAPPQGSSHVLNGRGLVVVPSLFCPAGYPICIDTRDETGPHVLFYPAVRDPSEARALWTVERPSHTGLTTLLGRTRAAVLATISERACTTSELARRCRISLASASEHATVLRQAGLIHTQRQGSAVLHTVTERGANLMGVAVV